MDIVPTSLDLAAEAIALVGAELEAGTVLGLLSCFLAREQGILPPYSDPAHLLLGVPEDQQLPGDLLYPVLFCGAVRGYSNRLLVRDGLDGATRRKVLGHLLAAV